jgi:FtsP/CotA-like multicopper oxidase with cupredoxin domain
MALACLRYLSGENELRSARPIRLFVLIAAILLCASAASAGEPLQSPGWDAALALTEAKDVNPDPDVVEIMLQAGLASVEIVPGVRSEVWAYNGGIPGPLIRVRRVNRLVVHFSNTFTFPRNRRSVFSSRSIGRARGCITATSSTMPKQA